MGGNADGSRVSAHGRAGPVRSDHAGPGSLGPPRPAPPRLGSATCCYPRTAVRWELGIGVTESREHALLFIDSTNQSGRAAVRCGRALASAGAWLGQVLAEHVYPALPFRALPRPALPCSALPCPMQTILKSPGPRCHRWPVAPCSGGAGPQPQASASLTIIYSRAD